MILILIYFSSVVNLYFFYFKILYLNCILFINYFFQIYLSQFKNFFIFLSVNKSSFYITKI
jgi:hypothetical protein